MQGECEVCTLVLFHYDGNSVHESKAVPESLPLFRLLICYCVNSHVHLCVHKNYTLECTNKTFIYTSINILF